MVRHNFRFKDLINGLTFLSFTGTSLLVQLLSARRVITIEITSAMVEQNKLPNISRPEMIQTLYMYMYIVVRMLHFQQLY